MIFGGLFLCRTVLIEVISRANAGTNQGLNAMVLSIAVGFSQPIDDAVEERIFAAWAWSLAPCPLKGCRQY